MAAESPLVRLWKRIPPSRHAETACCIDGPSRTKSQSRSGCGRALLARGFAAGGCGVEAERAIPRGDDEVGRVGREAAGGHAVGGWVVQGDFVLGHWVGARKQHFQTLLLTHKTPRRHRCPATAPARSQGDGGALARQRAFHLSPRPPWSNQQATTTRTSSTRANRTRTNHSASSSRKPRIGSATALLSAKATPQPI